MSKRVGIVGAGVTPFKGRWVEKTYYELAQMATREAVRDAGISIQDIDAVFYGIYNDIFERAAIPEHALHGLLGMQNKFGIRITTGGATGAYTISAAHAYLSAGRFRTALVLGVEKATDCFDFSSMSATPEVIKSIGWSGDSFFEQPIGWSASDSYAEVVLAYMDEHPGDLKPEITAQISSLEHSFAGKNQKIMSRIMSDYYASRRAYEMAGIKDPTESIQVIELHDAFVHQLEISMAEFGLVPLGRADSLIEDGLMLEGGKYLVNPCGGLIYCGHAVGASNIMSAWSARNELIKRGLHTALVHGTGSTVAQYTVCLILEHE